MGDSAGDQNPGDHRVVGSGVDEDKQRREGRRTKAGILRSVSRKYFVNYIEAMHAEGIAIDAITVENEPLNPKNTPSMVTLFAKEEETFTLRMLWGQPSRRQESGPKFCSTTIIRMFCPIRCRFWQILPRANTWMEPHFIFTAVTQAC